MSNVRVHVVDPANIYHLDKVPQRTGWHNVFGSSDDALNGNIARVFLTNIPQSIPSSAYQQETDYCCGAASIAIALGMSNDAEPHNWLMNNGYMTSAWGTEYIGVVNYLAVKGYNCVYDGLAHDGQMSGDFYDHIINHLNSGKKVILCMHGTSKGCRNNYWTSNGHFITLDAIENGGIGKIEVDGWWGQDTTRKAQSIFTPNCLDGIVSNQNANSRGCWENCNPDSWEWVSIDQLSSGSALIREIQKIIGATPDGFAGEDTCRKLQQHLSVTVDGRFGVDSVKAFQRWMNAY